MIVKAKKAGNFTTVYNEFIYDKNLSARAKGVLLWLMSKPDDWAVRKSSLHYDFKEGRDAIWKAFSELVDNEYVAVIQKINRTKSGEFKSRENDYVVYEVSMRSSQFGKLYNQALQPQNQESVLRSVINTNNKLNTEYNNTYNNKINTKGEQRVRGKDRFFDFLDKVGLEVATEKTLDGIEKGESISVSVLPDELLIALLSSGKCKRTKNNKITAK